MFTENMEFKLKVANDSNGFSIDVPSEYIPGPPYTFKFSGYNCSFYTFPNNVAYLKAVSSDEIVIKSTHPIEEYEKNVFRIYLPRN